MKTANNLLLLLWLLPITTLKSSHIPITPFGFDQAAADNDQSDEAADEVDQLADALDKEEFFSCGEDEKPTEPLRKRRTNTNIAASVQEAVETGAPKEGYKTKKYCAKCKTWAYKTGIPLAVTCACTYCMYYYPKETIENTGVLVLRRGPEKTGELTAAAIYAWCIGGYALCPKFCSRTTKQCCFCMCTCSTAVCCRLCQSMLTEQ